MDEALRTSSVDMTQEELDLSIALLTAHMTPVTAADRGPATAPVAMHEQLLAKLTKAHESLARPGTARARASTAEAARLRS